MLRSRALSAASFVPVCASQALAAAAPSLFAQRRFCSAATGGGGEPAAPPRLTRADVLNNRWGCTPTSSTDSEHANGGASSAPRAAASADPASRSGGGGLFARLTTPFRAVADSAAQLVRQVTRADERDEAQAYQRAVARRHDGQRRPGRAQKKEEEQEEDEMGADDDALFFNGMEEAETSVQYGGISWAVYQRLDVALQFHAPQEWQVSAKVSENFVGMQCAPQMHVKTSADARPSSSSSSSSDAAAVAAKRSTSAAPPLHGISISTFMYHARVPFARSTAAELLHSFLAQFHRSVGSTSVVLGSCSRDVTREVAESKTKLEKQRQNRPAPSSSSSATEVQKQQQQQQQQQITGEEQTMGHSAESVEMCRDLVKACVETDVAVCELLFRPPSVDCSGGGKGGATTAHALVKVFFHRARRRHTVVVFAVPDDEWGVVSKELVRHGVVHATELQGGDSRLETEIRTK